MLSKKILAATLIGSIALTTPACASWWTAFKADPAAQTASILNTVQTVLSVASLVFGQVKPYLPAETQADAQDGFDRAVLAVQHSSRLLQQAVQTAADQGKKLDISALIADVTKSVDDLQALINAFKGKQTGKAGAAALAQQDQSQDELGQNVKLLHEQVQLQ